MASDRAVTAAGTPALELVAPGRRRPPRPRVRAARAATARDRDRRPSYGTDAAAALGVDPGRVLQDARRDRSTSGSSWRSSRSTASSISSASPTAVRRPAGGPRRSGRGGAGDRLRRRRDQPARLASAAPGRRRRRRRSAHDDGLRVGRPARPPARAGAGRPGASVPTRVRPGSRGTMVRDDTIASGWHTGAAPRQAP